MFHHRPAIIADRKTKCVSTLLGKYLFLRACPVKDPFVWRVPHLAGRASCWRQWAALAPASFKGQEQRRGGRTASSRTLKLLFSGSSSPSAHPDPNSHAADGIGLLRPVPLGSRRHFWGIFTAPEILAKCFPPLIL